LGVFVNNTITISYGATQSPYGGQWGVAFIYACFGMAASAIHTNTAARALRCVCKKYLIITG